MKRVYLDMDGVISDFDGAVNKWYGKTNNHPDEWDYHYKEDFGMTSTQFWEGLTEEFWEMMPKTPEADLILAMVDPYEPCILSSPPLAGPNMPGLSGKVKWIKRNLPRYAKEKRYLLGSGKHYVAHHLGILIDDKNENIEDWERFGGYGILWPQPWNDASHLMDCRIEHLQNMLMALQGKDY